MILARADIVGAVTEHNEAIVRHRRHADRQAAILTAVAGTGAEHLQADDGAAELSRDICEREGQNGTSSCKDGAGPPAPPLVLRAPRASLVRSRFGFFAVMTRSAVTERDTRGVPLPA